jgi:hypothetical protein
VVLTLPPGYRPAKVIYFITYGSTDTQAYCFIQPDGKLVWDGGTNPSGFFNNTDYVGLSNISFRATH